MSKEAEMLAERIERKSGPQFYYGFSDAERALIAASLRAAARPSPDAGLVEREAIARVFDDWLKRYEHGEPIEFTPAREYAAGAVRDCRGLILALLSHRGVNVAGEAVESGAEDYCTCDDQHCCDFCEAMTAPAGRDPTPTWGGGVNELLRALGVESVEAGVVEIDRLKFASDGRDLATIEAGREVTFDHEVIIGAIRYDAGTYRITRVADAVPTDPQF